MIEITKELVFTFAAELVEERGKDYVNPTYFCDANGCFLDEIDEERSEGSTCRYVNPDGTPGCIAGSILAKAGLPLAWLAEQEGVGVSSVLFNLTVEGVVEVDRGGAEALNWLQWRQDGGYTWSEALKTALAETGL